MQCQAGTGQQGSGEEPENRTWDLQQSTQNHSVPGEVWKARMAAGDIKDEKNPNPSKATEQGAYLVLPHMLSTPAPAFPHQAQTSAAGKVPASISQLHLGFLFP